MGHKTNRLIASVSTPSIVLNPSTQEFKYLDGVSAILLNFKLMMTFKLFPVNGILVDVYDEKDLPTNS